MKIFWYIKILYYDTFIDSCFKIYLVSQEEYLPCKPQKQESHKQRESKKWLLLSVKRRLGIKLMIHANNFMHVASNINTWINNKKKYFYLFWWFNKKEVGNKIIVAKALV